MREREENRGKKYCSIHVEERKAEKVALARENGAGRAAAGRQGEGALAVRSR